MGKVIAFYAKLRGDSEDLLKKDKKQLATFIVCVKGVNYLFNLANKNGTYIEVRQLADKYLNE